MLISLNWIKEFVDLGAFSPSQCSTQLTLGVAEVEGIVESLAHLQGIYVAQITEVNSHPQADKLNLVKFDLGENHPADLERYGEVVCGAPNVKVGRKVPYAPLGTRFPNGLVLTPKKIRGVESRGMLCSRQELELGEDSSGLMVLEPTAVLGQNLLTCLDLTADTLLEIDNKSLTHRPDLWGHLGMAREFAAIFEKKFVNRYSKEWFEKSKSFLEDLSPSADAIEVEAKGDSSLLGYVGLTLKNVSVTSSPQWMQERLSQLGMRPKNSLVDISNYVMLELGIPNHIFDADKISGRKLSIERLGREEAFVTLDQQSRNLVARDTVISDQSGPLVLAGIMGGARCEVDQNTTQIFIEVGNWSAHEVRQSGQRLGLRTESSQRYEKAQDSQALKRTLLRLLELVKQFNPEAKVLGPMQVVGPDFEHPYSPVNLKLSASRVRKVLGHQITDGEIEKILTALDFQLRPVSPGEFAVEVPSWRATKDISVEVDLIEEVGRVVGYDNIRPEPPLRQALPCRLDPVKDLHRKITDFLVLRGKYLEVTTYPLVGPKLLKKAAWPSHQVLELANSLSEDQQWMRPTLVANHLDVASQNQKNYPQNFRFFEIGRAYTACPQNFSREDNHLCMTHFSSSHSPMLELLNTLEGLFRSLGVKADFSPLETLPAKLKSLGNPLLPVDWPGCHPVEVVHIRIMGQMGGVVTTIHPQLLKNYKMKSTVCLAVINLSCFEQRRPKQKIKYRKLAKFPQSTFECTVVTKPTTTLSEVLAAAQKAKIKEMSELKALRTFALSSTEKTVTLRATFGHPEKTLEGEFLTQCHNRLVETLKKAGFGLKS